MFSAPCYEVNAPVVAGEIIDGEAIILHLPRGHYYSSDGSGAFIWAAVELRIPAADIASRLAEAFAIAPAEAEAAVKQFLDDLAGHDLVRPCGAGKTPGDAAALPEGGVYAPPRLEIYTDMQDLLLLDPIHDVDAAGWPVAPDQAAA